MYKHCKTVSYTLASYIAIGNITITDGYNVELIIHSYNNLALQYKAIPLAS